MKILVIAFLALAVGTARAQDDAEAKKKRVGELLKQLSQAQTEVKKLLEELSGGDPEKMNELMREITEKYAPELAGPLGRIQTAVNDRNASATLRTLATAEADFRANDRDANRVNDFWVADVSGLYRIDAGGSIRLIEQADALADAKPCVPLDKEGLLPGAAKEHASKLVAMGKPAPKAGYWFAVIEKYQAEKGAEKGAEIRYNDGNGRSSAKFGLCAYPAEYGKTGKRTFILNEENSVWAKDTGGKPPDVFPSAPEKAGWTRLD